MTTFHQVPISLETQPSKGCWTGAQCQEQMQPQCQISSENDGHTTANQDKRSLLSLSVTSSLASSTSDIANLEGSDLLTDLWLGPKSSTSKLSSITPISSSTSEVDFTSKYSRGASNSKMWNNTCCLLNNNYFDNDNEYAQSLLPNDLINDYSENVNCPLRSLPALTEENLMLYNSSSSSLTTSQTPVKSNVNCIANCNYYYPQQQELFQFEQQKPTKSSSPTLAEAVPTATSTPSNNSSSSSTINGFSGSKNVNSQLYKTELCASFIKLGICPYGNKCQFAHGENELKVVERPPKWRSKPCSNWSKFGSCRYGNRCCFKHDQ